MSDPKPTALGTRCPTATNMFRAPAMPSMTQTTPRFVARITMSRDQANVTMDVDGDDQECRAQVATAYADVEAELTAMTTDYRAHGPSGYQIQRMRHTMLRDSRSGTFAVPRGVVPRLMRCLQRLGWTVEVRDPIRWSSRFAVDESVIENAKSASLKLALWSVVSQARAQVEYANRSEMTEMLRGMVCMYPSAGILIPVATRSAAWHIWMNLRSLGNIQLARGNW